MDEILKRLEKIEKLIESQNLVRKDVLNFNECCDYLELSQSHLYKLTSTGAIPHYKPNGKKIYFRRAELDEWLLRNRTTTQDEIESKAADYLIKKVYIPVILTPHSGHTDPPLGGSSFKEHRVVQYYLFFLNDSPFKSILIVW